VEINMATNAGSIGVSTARSRERTRPVGGLAFDWAMVGAGAWFLGGLFLDGWAHSHGFVDDTFWTPWHAVMYAGFGVVALVLLYAMLRNRRGSRSWRDTLPRGYELSALGIAIFAVGGGGDLLWHTLFGVEENVEALLSPTHLFLAVGAALFLTGPIRAAWHRAGHGAETRSALLPMLLALLSFWSMMTFMTQFAHPLTRPWAAQDAAPAEIGSTLNVVGADGGGVTRLTGDADNAYHPAWSPDGSRVVYTAHADGNDDLWLMNADGSGKTRLTTDPAADWGATWSPDGSRIAFGSDRDGSDQIYVMNADGSGQNAITSGDGDNTFPAWSPDGARIAFTSTRDGNDELYTINSDGNGLRRVTNTVTNERRAAWSPDGSQIAFERVGDGPSRIWIMNADGSGQNPITSAEYRAWSPAWSPDGSRIAFGTRRDGDNEVYAINLDGSGETNLSQSRATDDGSRLLGWSPDGSSVIYSSRAFGRIGGEVMQIMGVAGVMLQTALLMGLLLLAIRRWSLPFGSLTLLLTINAALMSVLEDTFLLVPALLVAGIVGDVLLWRLRPSVERQGALRVWAFALPVVIYGSYFGALMLGGGIWWTIHLWAGAIVIAGIVGLALSYVAVPPSLRGANG
jgi:hypothetical protein